ncbi:MAG: S1 RNA-binding domain-containing protein, partial [Allobranchiibius sp.]
DAFGDMDFKVAGTREFVTAIQLDTKLDGIPAEVLASALTQARDARLYILDVMHEAIDAPDEMSPFAPRVISVNVPVDKIGEVIGPKGKMIKQIQEDTGADISIEDDGTIYIGAIDGASAEAARAAINAIANPQMPEVGERFLGTVVKTTTFGAFVSLLPGKDGLLHISEVRKLVGGKRIDNVDDVLKIGQKVQVELKEVDPRGKLSLGVVEDAPVSVDAPAAQVAEVTPEAQEAPEAPAAPVADTAPVAEEPTAVAAEDSDGDNAEGDSGEGDKSEGERRPRNRRRGGRGRGNSGGNNGGNGGGESQSAPTDA